MADIQRHAFGLVVQPANVLAEHAQRDQLHAAQEKNSDQRRCPTTAELLCRDPVTQSCPDRAFRVDGVLYYGLSDHLGSSTVTVNPDGSTAETRYTAWGQIRYQSGLMQTDRTYTGQRSYVSDFGLHFYQARWYDSSLGRFTSADIIVPPGVQGLDRYAYVNNSPVKYTDTTGHFTDDEIRQSLVNEYGENEAERIFKLWQKDEGWLEILHLAQDGYTIWASEKGFGTFDVLNNGTITITWQVKGRDQITQLYEWQGQGGYLLQDRSGHSMGGPKCQYNLCDQAVYQYDDNGKIIGDQPIATRTVWWEKNLFNLPQPSNLLYKPGYLGITPAPFAPPNPCSIDVVCSALVGLGLVDAATFGIYSPAQWAEDTFYGLSVHTLWEQTNWKIPDNWKP